MANFTPDSNYTLHSYRIHELHTNMTGVPALVPFVEPKLYLCVCVTSECRHKLIFLLIVGLNYHHSFNRPIDRQRFRKGQQSLYSNLSGV